MMIPLNLELTLFAGQLPRVVMVFLQEGTQMAMPKRCAETLLDLVEVKLSCIEVFDRDDRREVALLKICRDELLAMTGQAGPAEIIRLKPAQGARAAAC